MSVKRRSVGRLHLVPNVNAPVADLPVRRVIGAHHFAADLTLPYGKVMYDYNAAAEEGERRHGRAEFLKQATA